MANPSGPAASGPKASGVTPSGAGPGRTAARRGRWLDLAVVLLGAALVLAAALVGRQLLADGVNIFLGFPPLLGSWLPHLGPGMAPAVVIALAVVVYGPPLAARMGWRGLLFASWAAAVGWTTSLALVDGYQAGIADRLTSDSEYLYDRPRVGDVAEMLRTFADHILGTGPEPWNTLVGAHPPGALLLFVWLDRIGLGGGGWAGMGCILVGASSVAAVAVTLRALGAEPAARAALPFAVLFPGAVWIGVSADGMFAGVLAWGVALLAVAATSEQASAGWRADLAALSAGVLLGYCVYLSYGLVLGLLLPLAVLGLTRRVRPAVLALLGGGAVAAAFTITGFWWLTGFERVQVIYAESVAQTRPYAYFVWANLAVLAIVLGPALLAGLRRLAAAPRSAPTAVAVLVAAGLAALLVADLTGLSKGEVERIWLPFAVWLTAAAALLPPSARRGWLIAQAVLALSLNHLLATVW